MAVVVGVVLTLVLAQIIDGRVAFFLGAGVTLSLTSWQRGRRSLAEFAGIMVAAALGLALFFALITTTLFRASALMGWVALAIGLSATWWGATWWSRRLLMADASRVVTAAANEFGMPTEQAREVLEKLGQGDRDAALAALAAHQQKQRAELMSLGVDVASLEPEVGKLIPWDKILRQVFRVLDFDRSDTTIEPDGTVKAASLGQPYGFLRVESPILNQPVRMPIIHRDDFWLASSVFDEPHLLGPIEGGKAELLVTYAPEKVLPGGFSGTPAHCLHYLFCPRGTLERYYPNTVEGDRRMARPEPETLFGPLVYHGEIRVGVNTTPAL